MRFSKLVLIFLILSFSSVHLKSKEEWKSRAIYQVLTDRFAVSPGQSYDPKCDLHNYCGGNYKGLKSKLDYIKNLGFNAIWISPIVRNFPGSYHGYHFTDLYQLNENFGSEQDFIDFVNEAHRKDIWIMVDVVANHSGPIGFDYAKIKPFNDANHYHDFCRIEDSDFDKNQWKVENCRLADLPDLKQENNYVRDTLLDWIKNLIVKYNIDGIRIDTIPEVPKWFWKQFAQAAGVYQVGEVFNGRVDFVASYQKEAIDAVLNYPLYFAMKDCFGYKQSLFKMESAIKSIDSNFSDVDALGNFLNNHDNARFLSFNGNRNNYINAIVFSLLCKGIPILYYGDEHYYSGGNDPFNREIMFNKFDQPSDLYQLISTLMKTRNEKQIWTKKQIQRYADDDFYAFTRGELLACFTNKDYQVVRNLTYVEYPAGSKLCNIFDPNDCVYFKDGKINIVLNGRPKVYLLVNRYDDNEDGLNFLS